MTLRFFTKHQMENNGERVDAVDENDVVLYSTTKTEAHKNGLLHRVVIAEAKNTQGDWLLIRQASDKQDAGQFVSAVGGHVEAGETEEYALRRETLEECGFSEFEFKLIGKSILNRHVIGRQENHLFVVYEIFVDEKDIVMGDEIESYKIFTTQELKNRLKNHSEEFGGGFHFVVENLYPELLGQ